MRRDRTIINPHWPIRYNASNPYTFHRLSEAHISGIFDVLEIAVYFFVFIVPIPLFRCREHNGLI